MALWKIFTFNSILFLIIASEVIEVRMTNVFNTMVCSQSTLNENRSNDYFYTYKLYKYNVAHFQNSKSLASLTCYIYTYIQLTLRLVFIYFGVSLVFALQLYEADLMAHDIAYQSIDRSSRVSKG